MEDSISTLEGQLRYLDAVLAIPAPASTGHRSSQCVTSPAAPLAAGGGRHERPARYRRRGKSRAGCGGTCSSPWPEPNSLGERKETPVKAPKIFHVTRVRRELELAATAAFEDIASAIAAQNGRAECRR